MTEPRSHFYTTARVTRQAIVDAARDASAKRGGEHLVHGHAHGEPCVDWCHIEPIPEPVLDAVTPQS